MSLLNPPKDSFPQQHAAPQKQDYGAKKKPDVDKAKTSQVEKNQPVSSERAAIQDTLDTGHSRRQRAGSSPWPQTTSGPTRPPAAPRATSEPHETRSTGLKRGPDEAQRSSQIFMSLCSAPLNNSAIKQLCHDLLPLTDHAEGFKAFTVTGSAGKVIGTTQMPDDLPHQGQVAHPTLARRVSILTRQMADDVPDRSTWHAVAKLLIGNRPLPAGFSRSGTRLLRRGGSFLLEASTAYGLPEPADAAFDDLARMHAVFLHYAGASSVAPGDKTFSCAALCDRINVLLADFQHEAT